MIFNRLTIPMFTTVVGDYINTTETILEFNFDLNKGVKQLSKSREFITFFIFKLVFRKKLVNHQNLNKKSSSL